jgi:predicted transcriptional regulator
MDLRLRRTAAGVSQVALARQMGVSRQRVGLIEGLLRPPVPAVRRYLDALAAADAEL